MQSLFIIIHVVICISLIALVLLQHGKGADMGAAFGSGASNTMFGSVGPAPFLMKVTTGLTAGFFVTSLILGFFASRTVPVSQTDVLLKQIEQAQPATPANPAEQPSH